MIVAHTKRRQENFCKMGSIDVKIGSEKPHFACTIVNISIAVYSTVYRKKVTADSRM